MSTRRELSSESSSPAAEWASGRKRSFSFFEHKERTVLPICTTVPVRKHFKCNSDHRVFFFFFKLRWSYKHRRQGSKAGSIGMGLAITHLEVKDLLFILRQLERERTNSSICWFTPWLATMASMGPAKVRSSLYGRETQILRCCIAGTWVLAFLGHEWGATLKVEQVQHELVPIWDDSVAGSSLTGYATMLAPVAIFHFSLGPTHCAAYPPRKPQMCMEWWP